MFWLPTVLIINTHPYLKPPGVTSNCHTSLRLNIKPRNNLPQQSARFTMATSSTKWMRLNVTFHQGLSCLFVWVQLEWVNCASGFPSMATPAFVWVDDCEATPFVAMFFESTLKYNNEYDSARRLHDYKHTWLVCVDSCTCDCDSCTFLLMWLHV